MVSPSGKAGEFTPIYTSQSNGGSPIDQPENQPFSSELPLHFSKSIPASQVKANVELVAHRHTDLLSAQAKEELRSHLTVAAGVSTGVFPAIISEFPVIEAESAEQIHLDKEVKLSSGDSKDPIEELFTRMLNKR